jgi:predicted CXXCH cytochrome family protein
MIILAGLQFTLSLPNIIYAFHEGGVGYCEGCHALHESDSETGYMIKGMNPSSTCLQCHSEQGKFYNVFSSDGSMYTPGGDFYWLTKTFLSTNEDRLYRSEGDNHGHNIAAADYGLIPDSMSNLAQGDLYPASAMGCNSCHNPHATIADNNNQAVPVSGSYGDIPPQGTTSSNYMLLGGVGYSGGAKASGFSFTYPAPVAVANPRDWTETDFNHPAYGSGMSEWCGNCHASLLNDDNKHPAGNNAKFGIDTISNYNAYVKTGDINGIQSDSYLSLTPFELGTTDESLLDPSSTSGPDITGKANVMCLTCHRAHASAFDDIGRWDFQTTFIADSHPGSGDSGITGNDVLNSYYGRNMVAEFGKYQRQFCNKCHVQD